MIGSHLAAALDAACAAARGERWQVAGWGSTGLRVEAREGRAHQVERWSSAHVTLRVDLGQGRVGFAASPVGPAGFDPADLAARALAAAAALDPVPWRRLPDGVDPADLSGLEIADPAGPERSEADLLAVAAAAEEAARTHDPRVRAVRKPACGSGRLVRVLRDQRGGEVRWEETWADLSVEAAAGPADGGETGWASEETRRFDRLDPVAKGREAARRAVELLDGRAAPRGRFPVVLEPRVAAELLEVLAPSFVAENHQKGLTFLSGRVGEALFPEPVDVVDDGRLPGGLDTQPVDDEGVARRATQVVRGGVLERLVHDVTSAARDGVASTGNAGGGPTAPPGPAVTNLYLRPGGAGDDAALVRTMGRGLLVREVLGLHTVDPVSGEFSLGCSGLWVEGDEPVHAVTGAAVAGDLLDLCRRVAAVGSDLRFQGAVGAPSLLVDGLDLS